MTMRSYLLLLPLLACGTILSAHAPTTTDSDNSAAAHDESGQPKKQEDETVKRAGEIATQPVRDVGLSKKKIPPILVSASAAPYARPTGRCSSIMGEMVQLNAVLGPDFGQPVKKKGSTGGKIAAAGGETLVNTIIPFRGLVREVSGAASADRQLAAAVNAGVARRGYLRGVGQARGCKVAGL